MKFAKKILAFVLVIIMAFSLASCAGLDAITNLKGGLEYKVYAQSGNEFSVITGIGSVKKSNVTILPKYEGYPVKAIAKEAFNGCTKMVSIKIPLSVSEIGENAFKGCTGLTAFKVPSSVTSIEAGVFKGCTGLKNITMPDDLRSIGANAFEGCTGLASVELPDSVRVIENGAFKDCANLKTITYKGTKAQWAAISKGAEWNQNIKTSAVHCTDGDVDLSVHEHTFEYAWTWDANAHWHKASCEHTDVISEKESHSFDANDRCTVCGARNEANVFSAGLEYSISINGGSYQVVGIGSCTDANVIIPAKINGKPVTAINRNAFENCTRIKSITIPASVTEIGLYAFSGCTELASFTVAEENTKYRAEGNCLIEKGSNTLIAGCKGSVIPSGRSVTKIGEGAFKNCTGLTSVSIPTGVTEIGLHAFNGCTGLTRISVAQDNEKYRASGNCVIEVASKTLVVVCKSSTMPIDGSVTSIAPGAYANSTWLSSIVIPEGVTTIGAGAFEGCTGLKKIELPDGMRTIGDRAFKGCISLTSIVHNGTEAQWNAISKGSSWAENTGRYFVTNTVTIPTPHEHSFASAWTSDADYHWHKATCEHTNEISAKAQHTFGANGECTVCGAKRSNPTGPSVGLKFKISSDRKSYAVAGIGTCKDTYIIIPSTNSGLPVTSIDYNAFNGCTNLTGVSIPDSVKSIGKGAFKGCTGLLRKEGGVHYADKWVVGCDAGVTRVTLRNDTVGIGNFAFNGCNILTSISIPDSVRIVEFLAFSGCTGLKSVTIGKGLSYIDEGVFDGCTNLTNIVIPINVTSIASGAFYDCTSLETITYKGTKAQWNAVFKASKWNDHTGSYVINCSDGNLRK